MFEETKSDASVQALISSEQTPSQQASVQLPCTCCQRCPLLFSCLILPPTSFHYVLFHSNLQMKSPMDRSYRSLKFKLDF